MKLLLSKIWGWAFKEQIEDKTTSLLVQIDNRIRILVMLQIMMLNISSPVYVITKISAIEAFCSTVYSFA